MTTSDHELIRNAIAYFPIAVDKGNYELLSKAFTTDAVIKYPEPIGTLTGLVEIIQRTKAFLTNMKTHHALTTQAIELTSENTATATTYCMAGHFGTGDYEGKQLTGWADFNDKLVKGEFDGEQGWRIVERVVDFHVPHTGDRSLFGWDG
ncbi:hypothetical protein ASPWEDRAFT_436824 [Aspergillus wentii DTO 134E9]|uniref:SnoaL-like domain-containing protein n=1 Tax=Aspergillus wentii DTO 134E9 TaxID=1073089 RepID=A0A1L9RQ63_ASPWE|nr:uncharacterized protein ASPWEDRAFT_436824 [Aspergillus wentii DTO 134E9]KAI9923908.1 hypothetical protein MW887_008213 [Aspergillus wentii]OJJ36958.1 hypothetical protein ASPWEDRAFT_436824 [Aspergillus wentii DTO 134E9]